MKIKLILWKFHGGKMQILLNEQEKFPLISSKDHEKKNEFCQMIMGKNAIFNKGS